MTFIFYVIRDPIVLLIYVIALKNRIFPKNGFVVFCVVFSLFFLFFHMFPQKGNFLTTLWGVRTYFFFVPFIFVVSKVLTYDDVEKIGIIYLIFLIFHAIISTIQFMLPPGHLINIGLWGTEQISNQRTALYADTIRPPGFFAAVTQAVRFLSPAAAFWIFFLSEKNLIRSKAKLILILISGFALFTSIIVSAKREALLYVLIVFLGAIIFLNKNKNIKFIIIMLIFSSMSVFYIAEYTEFGQKGKIVFQRRFFHESEDTEYKKQTLKKEIIDRVIGEFTKRPLDAAEEAPFFGYGIGSGTMAAGYYLYKDYNFWYAEEDWPRVVFEIGPFFGVIFFLFRIILSLFILRVGFWQARQGNLLPWFLACAVFFDIFRGMFWDRPAVIGFNMLTAGMCLAACKKGV
jgi:hypothetical protein